MFQKGHGKFTNVAGFFKILQYVINTAPVQETQKKVRKCDIHCEHA